MKTALLLISVLVILLLSGFYIRRLMDHLEDRREIDRLLRGRKSNVPCFSQDMISTLPQPVQRYFRFAIRDGTPLHTVAEITMRGQFGLGNKNKPDYMPMMAKQVLAAPAGFIWKMSGGSGITKVSGSDTATWTRFWLAGLIPVARTGDTENHARSAFGRYICEALFWTPAAFLPREGVTWEAIDDATARLTVRYKNMCQSVDLTINQKGQPLSVVLQRWSNANESGEFRLQAFGGHLSEFREFNGFMLPTHVEAGNLFGTENYFPFYIADITEVSFA